jgi:5-dehydro-4-deoxyglucarate dehydratase
MRHMDLRRHLESGILSFPVTSMTEAQEVDLTRYAEHVAWLAGYGPGALFAAGGTGEMFSLTPDEVVAVTRTAKAAAGQTPIVAGVGYGTRIAVDLARAVEAAGADAILLLPHYLIDAPQEGMLAHVKAVCDSVGIGVIIYSRDYSRFARETVARLAEACPNLIGLKDGTGDIETVASITASLGDRLTYVGGMPTHETYARAYAGAGMPYYSSAVFNFVPELALDFYRALRTGDRARMDLLLQGFFVPLISIRTRRKGYAVAMIKSGLRAVGRPDPGPVRAPLQNLSDTDEADLGALIAAQATLRQHKAAAAE